MYHIQSLHRNKPSDNVWMCNTNTHKGRKTLWAYLLCSYGMSTCSGSLTRALPLAIWPNYLQMLSKKVFFFLLIFTCVPCDMHVSVAWVCVCWYVCMWHACVCVHWACVCWYVCKWHAHVHVHEFVHGDMCARGINVSTYTGLYISQALLHCSVVFRAQSVLWGRAGLGTEITDLAFLWRWTLAFRFIHIPS